MSRVLNDLAQSERQYQQQMESITPLHSHQPGEKTTGWGWREVSLLLLPVAIACGGIGYHSYQSRLREVQEQPVIKTQIEEVAAPYQLLDYPPTGELQTTVRAAPELPDSLPETAVQPAVTQPEQASRTAIKQNSGDAALKDVDLSQLTPALAMRVQSAMNNLSDQPGVDSASTDAIPLTQHSDEWRGKLPAMNFQTHVYSSNVRKRWVKVDGVEHQEGDMINDKVRLVSIAPQFTVVQYAGKLLEIPALYDWKG